MTLKEIYESGKDVRASQIPEEWRNSFYKFMLGQTCTAEQNEDGSVKEYIYYSQDFRIWYNQNKDLIKSTERDNKINKIIDG